MLPTQTTLVLLTTCALLAGPASARHAYKHEAQPIQNRDLDLAERPFVPPGVNLATQSLILTLVTPSPGGKPIAITKQSQIITSYIPQFTLCELPPIANVFATPIPTTTTAPYKNFTTSVPTGNGTCTTVYSSTISMVCATVLTGLADKYTVSRCDQKVTFSSQFGYVLVTPRPVVTTVFPSVVVPAASAVPYPTVSVPSVSVPGVAESVLPVVDKVDLPSSVPSASVAEDSEGEDEGDDDEDEGDDEDDPEASESSASATPTPTILPRQETSEATPEEDTPGDETPEETIFHTQGTPLNNTLPLLTNATLPANTTLLLPNATHPLNTTHPTPYTTTITPAPRIQTLTTYLLAPWTQLTSAGPPTDIDKKICTSYPNGTSECIYEYLSWQTTTVTKTATTTTRIDLTTTIPGPSQILVETFRANVTDEVTVFELRTQMVLEWEVRTESTVTATREVPMSTRTEKSTVYKTYTVLPAS